MRAPRSSIESRFHISKSRDDKDNACYIYFPTILEGSSKQGELRPIYSLNNLSLVFSAPAREASSERVKLRNIITYIHWIFILARDVAFLKYKEISSLLTRKNIHFRDSGLSQWEYPLSGQKRRPSTQSYIDSFPKLATVTTEYCGTQ